MAYYLIVLRGEGGWFCYSSIAIWKSTMNQADSSHLLNRWTCHGFSILTFALNLNDDGIYEHFQNFRFHFINFLIFSCFISTMQYHFLFVSFIDGKFDWQKIFDSNFYFIAVVLFNLCERYSMMHVKWYKCSFARIFIEMQRAWFWLCFQFSPKRSNLTLARWCQYLRFRLLQPNGGEKKVVSTTIRSLLLLLLLDK